MFSEELTSSALAGQFRKKYENFFPHTKQFKGVEDIRVKGKKNGSTVVDVHGGNKPWLRSQILQTPPVKAWPGPKALCAGRIPLPGPSPRADAGSTGQAAASSLQQVISDPHPLQL